MNYTIEEYRKAWEQVKTQAKQAEAKGCSEYSVEVPAKIAGWAKSAGWKTRKLKSGRVRIYKEIKK